MAVVGYIVVGMLVMRFYRGAQGLEMIPNFSFWKDFPFLLKVNFTVYTPRISYRSYGGPLFSSYVCSIQSNLYGQLHKFMSTVLL